MRDLWRGITGHFLRTRGPQLLICLLLSACAGADYIAQAGEARARLTETEGGRLILEAIEAHGGLEAWYAAPTSSYAWEYSNFGFNMRFESYLVADNQSRRVYHELRTFGTPDSVEEVDGSFAWDGQDAWISPAEREAPNPRFWATTGYYFESIPFVMADPGVGFLVLSPEDLNGVPHERVMAYYEVGVGDSPGDTYTAVPRPSNPAGRRCAVYRDVRESV